MKSIKMSKNIDLNLLRIFTIVYQERNLKRAANILSLSPSSISLKINKLKTLVGEELFFKVPTGLEPTPIAERLYERTSHTISELLTSFEHLNGFDPNALDKPIRIDFGQNLISWLSPALASIMQKSCPDSYLIANYFTESTHERISKGHVDIGIQVAGPVHSKEIWTKEIGTVEMGAVVRKNHPLKKSVASIDEILEYDVVVYEQFLAGKYKGGPFVRRATSDGKKVNVKFRSPSLGAIVNMVKNSDMILPTCLNVFDELDDFRIIRSSDYPDLCQNPVIVFVHQKNRNDPMYQWLINIIEETFTRLNVKR